MIYYTIISTARTSSPLVSGVRRLNRGLRPTTPTSPRRPTARGALVRLQARDGSRTSDNEPSLACRASASITGCVRKSLLRLRPSACLTRDHRLGLAQRPKPDWHYTPLFGSEAKLAVERRSERADTAYSPRFREEEPSDAANERGRAQASATANFNQS